MERVTYIAGLKTHSRWNVQLFNLVFELHLASRCRNPKNSIGHHSYLESSELYICKGKHPDIGAMVKKNRLTIVLAYRHLVKLTSFRISGCSKKAPYWNNQTNVIEFTSLTTIFFIFIVNIHHNGNEILEFAVFWPQSLFNYFPKSNIREKLLTPYFKIAHSKKKETELWKTTP